VVPANLSRAFVGAKSSRSLALDQAALPAASGGRFIEPFCALRTLWLAWKHWTPGGDTHPLE
jgi:hypothetical protein